MAVKADVTFNSSESLAKTSGGPTSKPSSRPFDLVLYVTLPRYKMAERTEKILQHGHKIK